jgi:lysophospholipase L1-like esterase
MIHPPSTTKQGNSLFVLALSLALAVATLWPTSVRGGAGGPTTVPSATQPVIQSGTTNRHNSFVALARQGDIDLLFLGDSITDNWRNNSTRMGGKPVWDKHFAPLKAANFGISADRTQNVLWRIQNGELEGFAAKCIVLMIGTNNINRNTNEEVVEGVKAIVQEIRQRQPQARLLLLGIFPRAAQPADPYRASIKAVNAELAKLADGKNIVFLDIGDKFLTPTGELTADIMPDFLHPSPKGYEIWAEAILDKVKELMEVKP